MVSPYRLLFLAHNASGFDNWVVLSSVVTETGDLKILKTGGGLIPLAIRCVLKIVKIVEKIQYLKFTCTKSQMKGSLEKIGKKYGLQPDHIKGEIEHSMITKNNCASPNHN